MHTNDNATDDNIEPDDLSTWVRKQCESPVPFLVNYA